METNKHETVSYNCCKCSKQIISPISRGEEKVIEKKCDEDGRITYLHTSVSGTYKHHTICDDCKKTHEVWFVVKKKKLTKAEKKELFIFEALTWTYYLGLLAFVIWIIYDSWDKIGSGKTNWWFVGSVVIAHVACSLWRSRIKNIKKNTSDTVSRCDCSDE